MISQSVGRPDLDGRGRVVVVGAGPAGLACARRLVAGGERVLLLDAGVGIAAVEPPAAGPRDVRPDPADGSVPFRLETGRRTGLGGAGEAWHGQCMRLHAEDVEPRPVQGAPGWPLPLAELDRWYRAAEEFFEVAGAGRGRPGWATRPHVAPPAWDSQLLQDDLTTYAPNPRLGTRFAVELRAATDLDVVGGAVVTAVRLDESQAVRGLQVRTPEGGREIPARHVVLAAGAIENARILQLSSADGVGLGTGRWHTGRWLQDHPVVRTAEVVPRGATVQDRYTGLHHGRAHVFPKVRLAPALQRSEDLLDATAIFAHDLRPSALDHARLLAAGPRRGEDVVGVVRGAAPLARAVWRRYVRGLSSGLPADHVWLDLWLEQLPRSTSRVVLGDPGPDGARRSVVRWEVGDLEMRTSRRLTEVLGRELSRLGLGRLQPLPPMTDDAAWYAGVSDAFHPAGTTRMSVDPEQGVVDPELAVHGVDGLWVVGGSVFPTSGYANPTLTIVALALRLAHHLRDRRRAAA